MRIISAAYGNRSRNLKLTLLSAVEWIFFIVGLSFACLPALADTTYFSAQGYSIVDTNGTQSAPVPFTAVIQYDPTLLNFSPSASGYTAGTTPSSPGTSNPIFGSITFISNQGTETVALGGIQVDYYRVAGPISLNPPTPQRYGYQVEFFSRAFAFGLNTETLSNSPLAQPSPYWLPTVGSPTPTGIDGSIVPLTATATEYGGTNTSLQINSFSIGSTVSAIPEPYSYIMFLVGLIVLILMRRGRDSCFFRQN
ncbi:hypothetical protein AAKU58_003965 [Oxalobacteraceae bacterium GrIS 1.18]